MCNELLRTDRPARSGGPRQETRSLRDGATGFIRDDDGSMSIFALFIALSLVAIGGIGIDFMVAEYKRTNMQNTLDRAVLAAADLEQVIEPDAVVEDYFSKMSMEDALTTVTTKQGVNFKDVTGEASASLASNFTNILGLRSLNASALSRAEERIANVEVSMVLDISGSMAENSKMENLQTAANTFVDTVLSQENDDLVSISLVPYSEHVNAGYDITRHFDVDYMHDDSFCLEIDGSQFDSVNLDTDVTYKQMQHFQWNYPGWNQLSDTVCPRYDYEEITAFSQDAGALKSQIGQFQPRAGTSIFLGMKWATALLSPDHRPLVSAMAARNDVDTAFAGRPADWDDVNTLKTIVLMTDGQHDRSFRIADWAYNSSSEARHWSNWNLWHYLYNNVNYYDRSNFYYQKYSAGIGDGLLDRICDAAKAKDIVIWSIGFEVSDHGADVMRNCASSPAHFYRVEGLEIESAFYSIARAINQLRLIQ